ncbi:Predicted metal-binding protein [Palleronia marisminoris]|uniref:DUF1636 domain-containing protein n=1 Tax=Palleronia marisminoris TaxID=315423 RepID=A0A1Y5TSS9_9RHOB|nr:DUF1636 family protein [Palleronia marisminoris]SFH44370.1 Predicted metal-binding protein [Palleronia marisminoris]SLN67421.1 hypothetical protein PAM7066_03385 [Palleronia marisminoris]
MTAILHLCATCRPGVETGPLRDALPEGVELRLHECLNACGKPVALSVQGRGTGYLFAGVDPVEDAADIAATARTYMAAPGGAIEDARPCGRLRFCLIGRLPAI